MYKSIQLPGGGSKPAASGSLWKGESMTNSEKIQICREIVEQIQAESRRPMCRLRLTRESFSIADSHLGGAAG